MEYEDVIFTNHFGNNMDFAFFGDGNNQTANPSLTPMSNSTLNSQQNQQMYAQQNQQMYSPQNQLNTSPNQLTTYQSQINDYNTQNYNLPKYMTSFIPNNFTYYNPMQNQSPYQNPIRQNPTQMQDIHSMQLAQSTQPQNLIQDVPDTHSTVDNNIQSALIGGCNKSIETFITCPNWITDKNLMFLILILVVCCIFQYMQINKQYQIIEEFIKNR